MFSIARQQLLTRRLSSAGCAVARRQAAVVARTCGASSPTASRSVTYIGGYYSPIPAAANDNNKKNKYNIIDNRHYDVASSSLSTRMLSSAADLKESYDYILVDRRFPEDNGVVGGGVGVISLHRPEALNALCDALFDDLIHAVRAFDNDDDIGCIVITGSGKAFAAGEFSLYMMNLAIHS